MEADTIIKAYGKDRDDSVELYMNKLLDVCTNDNANCGDGCPFAHNKICEVVTIADKIRGV